MHNLPPRLAEAIDFDRLPPLGPGESDAAFLADWRSLTNDELFAPTVIRDRDFAERCRATVYLHRDLLDASHDLSQNEDSPTGSYLHGAMHRREPDFHNAKYWFRRVGAHPS